MLIIQKIFRSTVCALLVLFLFQSRVSHGAAAPAPRIFSPEGDQKQPLSAQIEYLEDADGTFTINQIASGQAGQFAPLEHANFGYGYEKKALWVRFAIDLQQYQDPYWFLTQNYEHVGSLILFYPTKEGFSSMEISENASIERRMFNIHNFLFKVPTSQVNPAVYYVRYSPQGHALNVDLSWSGLKGIVENIHYTMLASGLFFGILAAMWLYNLALCLYLRSRVYAYYIYYLGCFIALFVYLSGYVPLLFQLNSFYERLFAAFGYGLNHGTILFARSFLSLDKSMRRLDIYLRICQFAFIVGGVCAFILPGNPYRFLSYLTIATIPFLIYAGIASWMKGYAPAKLYSAGWIIFIIFIVTYCLRQVGILPSTWFTVYSIQIGSVWEAILFSLALAYRLKIIERETVIAKNTFLGMVSHELKTPLQTIASSIDFLSLRAQPRDLEVIERLNSAVGYLTKQIEDLTDYASLESGKLRLRLETFNASNVINEVVREYQSNAANRGLILSSDIENGDFEVRSDLFRIQQIINNLLSNAIKYTDHGRVNVNVRYLKSDSLYLLIQVEDTGIGISTKNIPLIFEPFIQLDQSSTRRHEGVGMGLAIVKQLIETLKGSIKITSEIGKGTVVEVRIPVEKISIGKEDAFFVDGHHPNYRILLRRFCKSQFDADSW